MSMKKILSSPLGIIITCFIALIIGLAAFMTIGFWPQSTARLERVANAFTPSSEWVLESNQIEPERHICLDARCGSVWRVWHGPLRNFGKCEEVYAMAKYFLGPRDVRNDVFEYGDEAHGNYITCDFKRVIDGIKVVLSYAQHRNDDYSTLILQLDQ